MKKQFSKADIEKARLNIGEKSYKFVSLGEKLAKINEAHKPKTKPKKKPNNNLFGFSSRW